MTLSTENRDVLVFDVDGTLTAARRVISARMNTLISELAEQGPVYAVSGANYDKLIEQLGEGLLNRLAGVFSCSGNEFWRQGVVLTQMRHDFDEALLVLAGQWVRDSRYPLRTGNHVEQRTGMLNISTVGRNASMPQRAAYHEWDRKNGERQALAVAIERAFPGYEARLGGQISVDVTLRGWNKGRVAGEIASLHPGQPIRFFGDSLGVTGNDRPLADALLRLGSDHTVHEVTGPAATASILRELYASAAYAAA